METSYTAISDWKDARLCGDHDFTLQYTDQIDGAIAVTNLNFVGSPIPKTIESN
ncbi:MAG: hypothetical protein IGR76_12990 [Synechococcales cyanobacterium T60_A2020_003]|nr:hypothetical protein [Synechococcales cyanobacterium T60_A2020_003]